MTLQRMDNVGIVVESLDTAISFLAELGLELEGRAMIEGDWSGRVTGLCDQPVEIAMMRHRERGDRRASSVEPRRARDRWAGVFERTREIGMLRAVAMTRRQVRRMIRYESIVTALIGAALGIDVGIFLAAIHDAPRSPIMESCSPSPYKSLAALVVIAILAGRAGGDPARPPSLESQRPRSAPVRVTPSPGRRLHLSRLPANRTKENR